MTTQAISTSTGRPQWIRTAIYADALVTDLSGVALVVGSGTFATHLGVPSSMVVELGIGLFLYAIGLFIVANRWLTTRNLMIIGMLDVAWIVVTEALLLSNALPMTNDGRLLLGMSHLVVGAFAVTTFIGARQLHNS